MEKKTTPKRILIDITESLHNEVKARAAYRNISMRTWITRAITEAIKNEDKYREKNIE